jgi:succinate dehydrogenase / fumarate reductase cytochrome b subunit
MNNKKRPLSPHLTIYKPQMTSVLSIMHRITGAFMFFGLISILWVVNYYSINAHIQILGDIISCIGASKTLLTIVILWSYCIFYHMCAGIRYFIWDSGKCMEIKMANCTGWIVLICSILLTYIFWHAIIF